MFRRMLIRKKILYSTVALTFTLLLLMYCSLRGVYAYRELTKSIGTLSGEFTDTWRISQIIDDLRDHLRHVDKIDTNTRESNAERVHAASEFYMELEYLGEVLELHEDRIRKRIIDSDPLLATNELELGEIVSIREKFQAIEETAYDSASDRQQIDLLLQELNGDLNVLFGYMTDRGFTFRERMRARYHTWYAVIGISALASLINVGFSFWFFRHSVVQPFKLLLADSRAIAGGEFDRRIELKSQDELAELADSMNSMTDRFVQIRNNLNEQVQLRTREVVRSEQLASVGFLAAGVAHEINNPLASIAWSAEALESRLHEVLHPCNAAESDEIDEASVEPDVARAEQTRPEQTRPQHAGPAKTNPEDAIPEPSRELTTRPTTTPALDAEQVEVIGKYLKRIIDEAFRCKGITERLLDFSRLGESQTRERTDIHQAVTDVVALVRHLGQYRNRSIQYNGTPGLIASVSPTEFKQVVLNLVTNALDASDDGDVVEIRLDADAESFTLRVEDHGCGMSSEVLRQLFEPFFTRRRDGRGTGLGLSITYRIVQDHGGTLVPSSPGVGQGSTLELTLPLNQVDTEAYERRKAA